MEASENLRIVAERLRHLRELDEAITELLSEVDSGEFHPQNVAAIQITRLRQQLDRYDGSFPLHDLNSIGGHDDGGTFCLSLTEHDSLVRDLLDDQDWARREIERLSGLQSESETELVGADTSASQPMLADIPPLDNQNGHWVLQDGAAELACRSVQTLANDRSAKPSSQKAEDGLSGIDRRGRVWRKRSKNSQQVWYLKSSLSCE